MPAVNMPMNLEELLDGIPLPATRVELVTYAMRHGAGEDALIVLRAMPAREYKSMEDINAGLGLLQRQPGEEELWAES